MFFDDLLNLRFNSRRIQRAVERRRMERGRQIDRDGGDSGVHRTGIRISDREDGASTVPEGLSGRSHQPHRLIARSLHHPNTSVLPPLEIPAQPRLRREDSLDMLHISTVGGCRGLHTRFMDQLPSSTMGLLLPGPTHWVLLQTSHLMIQA